MTARLIVFSGLPGTGKTTIARSLARRIHAVYLRIDTIEQALRDAGMTEIGPNGYTVACELARNNLGLGSTVVADCVNPVAESRQAWGEVAVSTGAALLNIEVVCSDENEHRRRVQTRTSDVPGLIPPTWQSVCSHEYQAWDETQLRIDSAALSPSGAVDAIIQHLRSDMHK